MEYVFSDIIDVPQMQSLVTALHEATGIPTGLVDARDGSILTSAGWQDVCLRYHRAHPASEMLCRRSAVALSRVIATEGTSLRKCQHGLWDIGTPVVVRGQHLATLFLGQFFLDEEEPDWDFFRQQAVRYDFDVATYLEALRHLPQFSRDKVESIIQYNATFAIFLQNLAESRLALQDEAQREQEMRQELARSASMMQSLMDAIPNPIFAKDAAGRYIHCNAAMERMTGYPREALLGHTVGDVYQPDQAAVYQRMDDALFECGGVQVYDSTMTSADGILRHVLFHKALYHDSAADDAAQPNVAGMVGVISDITERVEAEKELLQSRQELDVFRRLMLSMTDNMLDMLWAKDSSGRYLFANGAIRQHLLCSDGEEVIGRTDVYFANRQRELGQQHTFGELCVDSDEVVLQTRKPGRFIEDGLVRGRYLALDVQKSPLYDGEGRLVGTVGTARDITEQRLAEAALAQSEERFRSIVETANEGIWALDEQDFITYLNPAMAHMLGYDRVEMLGQLVTQFFFPEDLTELGTCRLPLHGGDDVRHERRLRSKAGGEVWTLASTVPMTTAEGRCTGSYGMFADITERKRVQRILESRVQLGQVAAFSSLGGVLQYVLDVAEAITQSTMGFFHFVEDDGTLCSQSWSTRTRATCKAKTDDKHYAAEDAGVWSEAMRTGVAVIHNDYVALPGRKGLPAGHIPLTRELVVPIVDKGRLVALVGVGNKPFDYDERDVDTVTTLAGLAWEVVGRMRAQDELVRSKELAESAAKAKSEFLANMSHEVRTPLNGVLGILQLLQQDATPEEKLRLTSMAYNAGRRLLALLNDILDFSRMDAGQLQLAHEPFTLEELFDDVAGVFTVASHEKGLEMSLSVHESVPAVLEGDGARIRQVLFNLVGNAIKFTPSGFVRLEAWAAAPSSDGRVRVYIGVSDSGIGIPAGKQELVFERFTQMDGSYRRRYEGAGLGLAIVKRIVGLMHGGIAVDSEEGGGTTIYLDLPLQMPGVLPSVASPDAEAFALAGAVGAGLRILLVEDDRITQMYTQVMLQRMGHVVSVASNGQEAVAAVLKGGIDCVLMDIQMPEMDGVQATRLIRSVAVMDDRAHLPIIAVTAYAMAGDRETFLAAGMDDYVTKPLSPEDLQRALQKVVEGRGRMAASR